jgi:hypothetical protein
MPRIRVFVDDYGPLRKMDNLIYKLSLVRNLFLCSFLILHSRDQNLSSVISYYWILSNIFLLEREI